MDHFINGAFYLHAPTGDEIARGIETLRAKRLYDFQVRVHLYPSIHGKKCFY